MRFHRCLALEYQFPATFGAMHHLTVLCYMLQHNLYSEKAWHEAHAMLAQFLDSSLTTQEFRQRNHSRLNSVNRKHKITSGATLPQFSQIKWTATIADIRFDQPDDYIASVQQWAESLLADIQFVGRAAQ